MSPDKVKKRKLKERSIVDKEIMEELRTQEKKKKKSKLDLKKKRKRDKENGVGSVAADQLSCKDDGTVGETNHEDLDGEHKSVEKKRKKKNKLGLKTKGNRENENEVDSNNDDRVSADEDAEDGMILQCLIKYKESRPGMSILQQRIDDYITAYEEQLERKERESEAAGGGWTIVVHHKGRKKTTYTESGVTVGFVVQAAVVDKMGKKE